MMAHCLICNLSLEESFNQVNLFNVVDCPLNKLGNSETINNTLYGVLVQILNQPLGSVLLHSQVLCQDCYSKVVAIIDVQNKLQELQTELISSFEKTACARMASVCTNNIVQGPKGLLTSQTNEQKPEGSSIGDPSGDDLAQFTSSMDIKSEGNISPLQEQNSIEKSLDYENLYVCEKCGESFSSNNDWVEHMLIHIDSKPQLCPFCKKTFPSLNALKVHERTHKDYKPYKCEKCNKSFSERNYLTEHALVHTDSKPFKCSICDRDFARRKDMTTHLKIHSGDRPHSCPHCPKKFVVKSRLNRHLKTHLQDRPHKCNICLKSFVRLNDFKTHERLHTGVKPYKCSLCEKSFGSLSNFRAHERRHRNAIEKKSMMNPIALPDSTDEYPTNNHLTDGNVVDPLDVKPTKEVTILEQQTLGVSVSENLNRNEQTHQTNREMMPGTEAVIFSSGDSQTATLGDVTKGPQRLPSLVNFRNPRSPSATNESSESTLPLGIDLSNVAVPTENANITGQKPIVVMFPLIPEPPPLLIYSTHRNSDQGIQLANSMLAEPASQNNLSQLQALRWDNEDEVDALLRDTGTSNGHFLAQTLFQSKEISDAF